MRHRIEMRDAKGAAVHVSTRVTAPWWASAWPTAARVATAVGWMTRVGAAMATAAGFILAATVFAAARVP
jgi:hypothetical protein